MTALSRALSVSLWHCQPVTLKCNIVRLCRKTEELYMHMCMWMVRIESELVATDLHNVGAVLNARSKLLLNGILLANQVSLPRE